MSDFVGTMAALKKAAEYFILGEDNVLDLPLTGQCSNNVTYNKVSVEIGLLDGDNVNGGYTLDFVWFVDPMAPHIRIHGIVSTNEDGTPTGVCWEIDNYDPKFGHELDEWLLEWKIAA